MTTLGSTLRTRVLGSILTVIALAALPPAAFSQSQPQFTVLHSFTGTDGFGPMAGVVQGADGAIYGTTSRGGTVSLGTVFRLDLTTLHLTTLYHFAGVDGSLLYSGLILAGDGHLYGSTNAGGTLDLGTLFRVGPDGQNFASLHSFTGVDGAKPDDLKLTEARDGAFYGTTSEGGPAGGGTLFRLDAASGVLTTLYSFLSTDAGGVHAGLIAGQDGYWYGTTYSGGANGAGSVFRVDPATATLTTLHDFAGPDGQNPVPGALMQGSDGNLYGTTQLGGNGTVFKLNPTTRAFATLHMFSGINDGRFPLGGVTEGGDGYLYGTTVLGGQGFGTVFRVHPATLAYDIVVAFGNSNGRSPSGNLFRASDGALYGVTRLGGDGNAGTVFRLSFDDTTPPTITSLTADPSVLWPPNGRMAAVTVTVVATDAVDPAPACAITSVTSNQANSGWVVIGDLTVYLRVRRLHGSDRIYTITVQCTDASGNTATDTVDVTVSRRGWLRPRT